MDSVKVIFGSGLAIPIAATNLFRYWKMKYPLLTDSQILTLISIILKEIADGKLIDEKIINQTVDWVILQGK